MSKTILGKKIGMTQIFTEEGTMIPVTVIEATPNKVIQIKTKETDGYDAVQIGFAALKENRANKPTKGHFARWETPLMKHITEVRLAEGEVYETGMEISVEDFEEGKKLDITGVSKGKGTQGNIKRHGHHRGPMTHGSKHKRLAGALAAGTYPSRVFKGNDGPGRMGRDTVTIQNIDLVKIIPERNIMLVKGAVPGSRGSVVRVCYAVKAGYPLEDQLVIRKEIIIEEPAVEEVVVSEVAEEAAVLDAAAEAVPEAVEDAASEAAEQVAPPEELPAVEAPAAEAPAEEETPAAEEAPAEEEVKEGE